MSWWYFPNHWPFVRALHWPMDSPHRGPVMWSFDVVILILNKQLMNRWFEVPWGSWNVTVKLVNIIHSGEMVRKTIHNDNWTHWSQFKLLGVYWFHSVRLSVHPPASRVHSVAPTVLVGSISYLYILSSNCRGCVTCTEFGKILKFEVLAIFSNL